MIFELILKFFGIENHQVGGTIETFHTIPEIIAFFQKIYPEANVEKTPEDSEELGIYIKRKDVNRIFIPIRESQKSGYFLIEVPSESSLS
ncbi:MAG TPA: hypothetical protein PLX69_22240 [Leptospiraceae bacterium]|nr:hypothetical protein [Leptospiraceae bacterium]HRG77295.1 hypothetical protein [Leptospiraceae bacterium]